jgi:hypothetical protein
MWRLAGMIPVIPNIKAATDYEEHELTGHYVHTLDRKSVV